MWFFSRKPEQPEERHTGGIVAVIHQREQPIYPPPAPPRPGTLAREWAATHPRGNTESLSLRRIAEQSRVVADVPTQKKLQPPSWLVAEIPQGLPVQKPAPATPEPCQADAPSPPSWLISPDEIEQRISAALPPAPSDAHPGPMPTQEMWERRLAEINTPPVLAPLPEDAIAVTDRTAANISYVRVWEEPEQTTSALEQLSVLAKQPANDDTLEVPAIVRKQHEKKESE